MTQKDPAKTGNLSMDSNKRKQDFISNTEIHGDLMTHK